VGPEGGEFVVPKFVAGRSANSPFYDADSHAR
jgi:hypothetical protein